VDAHVSQHAGDEYEVRNIVLDNQDRGSFGDFTLASDVAVGVAACRESLIAHKL
jgi:hypothetical protein